MSVNLDYVKLFSMGRSGFGVGVGAGLDPGRSVGSRNFRMASQLFLAEGPIDFTLKIVKFVKFGG